MPSVTIPLSGRLPGRAVEPSRTRVGDGGGIGHLLENMVALFRVFGSKTNLWAKGQLESMKEAMRWGPCTASPWVAPGVRLVAVWPPYSRPFGFGLVSAWK